MILISDLAAEAVGWSSRLQTHSIRTGEANQFSNGSFVAEHPDGFPSSYLPVHVAPGELV